MRRQAEAVFLGREPLSRAQHWARDMIGFARFPEEGSFPLQLVACGEVQRSVVNSAPCSSHTAQLCSSTAAGQQSDVSKRCRGFEPAAVVVVRG